MRQPTPTMLAFLKEQNKRYPEHLVEIPREQWPAIPAPGLVQLWRSRRFLVQIFAVAGGAVRLSICRTQVSGKSWTPGITWDELQQLKAECGFAERCAVELFPPASDVVNVANIRHLFVIETPSYCWRNQS